MAKRVWLKTKDYVDKMPHASKMFWNFKMITYINQQFGGGIYTGIFQFNYKNPLTWLFIFLIYITCISCCLWEAIIRPVKATREFIRDGVQIEIRQNS